MQRHQFKYTKFLLLFWVIVSCVSVKEFYLPKYETEISFYGGTDDYYSNQNLKKCKLKKSYQLGKYSCRNWLHLFENGDIKQYETSIALQKHKYKIPAGSILFFNRENHLYMDKVYFSSDVLYDNSIEIKGGNKISSGFHSNGELASCFLTKDQKIQGVHCKSSLFHYVQFDSEGQLIKATLAADTLIQDRKIKKGSTISIRNGHIEVVEE